MAVPLSIEFYSVMAFSVAWTSASVSMAMAVFAVFHWIFYEPLFGIGTASRLEFGALYTTTVLLHSIAGRLFTVAVGTTTMYRSMIGGAAAASFTLSIIASTLPFEVVPLSYVFPGIITMLCIVIVSLAHREFVRRALGHVGSSSATMVAVVSAMAHYLTVTLIYWAVMTFTSFSHPVLGIVVGACMAVAFGGAALVSTIRRRRRGRGTNALGNVGRQRVPDYARGRDYDPEKFDEASAPSAPPEYAPSYAPHGQSSQR